MKNLPVPVFLRPLDEKDASMKVFPPACWCNCYSFNQHENSNVGMV